MTNKPHVSDAAKAAKAASTLDVLLTRAVSADQRANKPASQPVQEAAPMAKQVAASNVAPRVAQASPGLERLTVRFTHEESRKLESVRAAARAMGYKLSDTAVFRLGLLLLNPGTVSAEQIEKVLEADTRRRH
jgi:hypothetical protein